MLILTVGFLLLGVAFKWKADTYKGVSASTGVMIDGEYREIGSGKIGENREQVNLFNTGGTMFWACGCITGVTWVVLCIKQKQKK